MDISGVFKKISNSNSLTGVNHTTNKENIHKTPENSLKLSENQSQLKGEIINVPAIKASVVWNNNRGKKHFLDAPCVKEFKG